MYRLFIHSSVVRHLGGFPFLAIMKVAPVNGYKFLCGHVFSFFWGVYLGMELLGHLVLCV